jgi:hypothetical protein
MECWKCGKDMDNKDENCIFRGIDVNINLADVQKTPENIAYVNRQLGKYSNGKGECHIAICYECYVDGLFQIWQRM